MYYVTKFKNCEDLELIKSAVLKPSWRGKRLLEKTKAGGLTKPYKCFQSQRSQNHKAGNCRQRQAAFDEEC